MTKVKKPFKGLMIYYEFLNQPLSPEALFVMARRTIAKGYSISQQKIADQTGVSLRTVKRHTSTLPEPTDKKYFYVPAWLLRKDIPALDKLVWAYVSSLGDSNPCTASNEYIAKTLHLNIRTVKYCIHALIENGWLISGRKQYKGFLQSRELFADEDGERRPYKSVRNTKKDLTRIQW